MSLSEDGDLGMLDCIWHPVQCRCPIAYRTDSFQIVHVALIRAYKNCWGIIYTVF